MNRFDEVAKTWDENPVHLERSKAIAVMMEKELPLGTEMDALEFGAGTGLLSFLLAGSLHSITMVDNSQGMVQVMQEKVAAYKTPNVHPILMNLEEQLPAGKFHLLYNQMVLHHVQDVPGIFQKFHSLLLPGGTLFIADLFPEDGSFHGAGFDGHFGFDPEVLGQQLIKVGFTTFRYETCFVMKRKMEDGTVTEYPIFLLTAKK
ncbi:MAG: methyltransferase domain-containing protein [Marinilabiliales bacterium]|nr:methyltransferase domain-containing protein [Marinilabiliales bacterium]